MDINLCLTRKCLAGLILCLKAISVHADTVHNESIWLTYGLQYSLTPQWRLSMQIQPYWREHGDAYDQVTYRPGVYYSPNQDWTLGGGYVYFMSYPEQKSTVHEHRWWGDVIRHFNPQGDIAFTLRSRLEHRDIEGQSNTVNAVRELVRMSYRLNQRWQVVISNEWYYTLNHTQSIQHGFDQNRLFVGVATNLSAQSTLEFGVLDQYAKRSVHDTDTLALAFTLNQRF